MATSSCTAELKLTMIRKKRQQSRNYQQRCTVFNHDFIKRRGPDIGSQNTQNFNQKSTYGDQKKQSTYRQTGFYSGRNRNSTLDRQYPQDRSSNCWNNGTNNREKTQYNFNTRPGKSDTQNNNKFPQSNNPPTPNSVQFIDDQGQDVMNTLSSFFPLNI